MSEPPKALVPDKYFALGPIRNTHALFAHCCQSQGALYDGGEGRFQGCYRACNITSVDLYPNQVRACVEKELEEKKISNYMMFSSNGSVKVTPTTTTGVPSPTGSPTRSPSATGGAATMGGATGYVFLGVTLAGAFAGLL